MKTVLGGLGMGFWKLVWIERTCEASNRVTPAASANIFACDHGAVDSPLDIRSSPSLGTATCSTQQGAWSFR
jgi:hypothetical protein